MLSRERAAELPGATVFDNADEELGEVEHIYLGPGDDQRVWAAVQLEDRRVVVPLVGAEFDGMEIRVPYPYDMVLEAPDAPDGTDMDADTHTALHEHYRLFEAEGPEDPGPAADAPVPHAPEPETEASAVDVGEDDDEADDGRA